MMMPFAPCRSEQNVLLSKNWHQYLNYSWIARQMGTSFIGFILAESSERLKIFQQTKVLTNLKF